jgi:hypothetical protein
MYPNQPGGYGPPGAPPPGAPPPGAPPPGAPPWGNPPGGGYPGGGYPGGGGGYPGGGGGYPGGGYPGGGGFGGGYEFGPMENQIIDGTAGWARALAIILIIIGAINCLQCNLIGGILSIVMGVTLNAAATSLKAVVNTQGNDIGNMMTALGKIGGFFKIRVISTLIGLGIALLVALAVGAVLILALASK